MFLNREALLKKEELKISKIEFDNGDFVFVRQMNGTEKDQFEESLLVETKDEDGVVIDYQRSYDNFRARLAVATICNQNGTLLLKPEDAKNLGQAMSASKLMKIVGEATKLNSISKNDQKKMIKNSEGGQTESSHSDSAKK